MAFGGIRHFILGTTAIHSRNGFFEDVAYVFPAHFPRNQNSMEILTMIMRMKKAMDDLTWAVLLAPCERALTIILGGLIIYLWLLGSTMASEHTVNDKTTSILIAHATQSASRILSISSDCSTILYIGKEKNIAYVYSATADKVTNATTQLVEARGFGVLSCDGRYFALVPSAKRDEYVLGESRSGKVLIDEHGLPEVYSVELGKKCAAIATRGGAIRIRSIDASDSMIDITERIDGGVERLAVSNNDSYIAWSTLKTVGVFHVELGKVRHKSIQDLHAGNRTAFLGFSESNKFLLSCGRFDKTCTISKVDDLSSVVSFSVPKSPGCASFDEDKGLVWTGTYSDSKKVSNSGHVYSALSDNSARMM